MREGGPDPSQEGDCTLTAEGSGSVGWPSPPAPGSEGPCWGSPEIRGAEEKPGVSAEGLC